MKDGWHMFIGAFLLGVACITLAGWLLVVRPARGANERLKNQLTAVDANLNDARGALEDAARSLTEASSSAERFRAEVERANRIVASSKRTIADQQRLIAEQQSILDAGKRAVERIAQVVAEGSGDLKILARGIGDIVAGLYAVYYPGAIKPD